MAINTTEVVMVYVVLGAVMVGAGVVSLGDSGMLRVFAGGSSDNVQPNNERVGDLEKQQSVVGQVLDSLTGGLTVLFNLLGGMFRFMNWPITLLTQINAPPSATLVLGVPLTAAFYMSIARAVT